MLTQISSTIPAHVPISPWNILCNSLHLENHHRIFSSKVKNI
jgi:hypothetical protein